MEKINKDPLDIVKYILFRYAYDGDLVTNLKMQKVLYFVYAWCFTLLKQECFEEKFQAWPNGPVLPSLYTKLKIFGGSPIDFNFSQITNEKNLADLKNTLGEKLVHLVDKVYEKYACKSAFEMVNITHSDPSWLNARKGLSATEPSNNEILEEDIISYYAKQAEL